MLEVVLWYNSSLSSLGLFVTMPTLTTSEIAKLLLNPSTRVAFLTGAGVSVASGIPDFRSPGGMYETLKPELLTASRRVKKLMEEDPTYVVSWEIFRKSSLPYLEVRQ